MCVCVCVLRFVEPHEPSQLNQKLSNKTSLALQLVPGISASTSLGLQLQAQRHTHLSLKWVLRIGTLVCSVSALSTKLSPRPILLSSSGTDKESI